MVSRRSNVVDVKETCIKSVMYVQRSCFGLKSNWFFTLSLFRAENQSVPRTNHRNFFIRVGKERLTNHFLVININE